MSDDTRPILRKISHYLPNLEAELKARGKKPEMPIRSLSELNEMLWGIPRGKMTVIAARTSMGKTAFSQQIAYDLVLAGKKVLFFSLEMSVEDMLERLFCYEYRVSNMDILRGDFSSYVEKFQKFKEEIKSFKFAFTDCIGKKWHEIDELLNNLNPKPDAIFIDHLNAIRMDGFNDKRIIDDYLLNLFRITRHHNIATVLCCQINRDNQKDDNKIPQLHELKGSGCIEEMADRVILLHWPHKYQKEGQNISKNKYLAIVAKNRNGPTGYVELYYQPQFYSFSNRRINAKAEEEKSQLDFLNQQTEPGHGTTGS